MTISWMRMETEFCSNCWLMLRSVLSSALNAKTTSCSPARKTIMPTAEKVGPGSQLTPRSENLTWSGRWKALILIPATTALVSVRVKPTEIVGMTPAKAVVANRAMVTGRLASQTRPRTWGSAAVVPVTACLRLSQRPRRSFGPSGCCGGSSVGSPVKPLFAGPLSGLRRPRPQPPHQITGPWEPGGIIPMWW